MSSISIFSSENYKKFQEDFNIISTLNTTRGDKFAVNKKTNELLVTEGGFFQAFKRMAHGYNRYDVLNRLKVTEGHASSVLEGLKEADLENVDRKEFRTFEKEIDRVATKISELQSEYRNIRAFPASKDQTPEKLSEMYRAFYDIKGKLKELQSNPVEKFSKPLTDLSKVDKAIDALTDAQKKRLPQWKRRVGDVALGVLSTMFLGVPLFELTLLKWVIWNPVEFLVRGKVTTKNPVSWWIDNLNAKSKMLNDKTEIYNTQWKIEGYARRILYNSPIVTDGYVDAYCALLPHLEGVVDRKKIEVDLRSLELIFEKGDIEHLWPKIEEECERIKKSNFGPQALPIIEEFLCRNDNVSLTLITISLIFFNEALQWIDDPTRLSEDGLKEVVGCVNGNNESAPGFEGEFRGLWNRASSVEERTDFFNTKIKPCLMFRYADRSKDHQISVSNLIRIIKQACETPKCKEISIPHSADGIPEVMNMLKEHGFTEKTTMGYARKN